MSNRFKSKEEIEAEVFHKNMSTIKLSFARDTAVKLLGKLSPLRATNVASIRHKVDFCELYELVMQEVERPDREAHESFQDFLQIKDPYVYNREEFKPISRRTKW